jgi:exodeoxyribonuclease VII small subunit
MARERFEEAMKKLEDIVARMETGELSLDESLKAFEEGIRLIRLCNGKLDEAQRRIDLLVRNDREDLEVTSFAVEGNDHDV